MNNQSSGSENSQRHEPLAPAQALSTDALARRRLLLKGATGGTAALAALTPVGALATGSGGSTVLVCASDKGAPGLCTLSGVGSAAHSFGPLVTKISASGKNAAYWKNLNYWPTTVPATLKTAKVKTLLGTCTNGEKQILYVLQYAPTSVEALWICAYLNGAKFYDAGGPSQAKPFPYSSVQVMDFWKNANTRMNAQALFSRITTQSA